MAYTCAVAARDNGLFLLLSVCRGPEGDVYANIPRDPTWQPHSSYHASGQHHHKSFGYKLDVKHRQKPDASFSGTEIIVDCPIARSEPRAINAPCSPSDFSEVFEIPLDEIGEEKYLTHVRVDLVGPNASPTLDPGSRVIRQHTIVDRQPNIVITLYESAGMRAFFANRRTATEPPIEERSSMPTLKLKKGEIKVPKSLVIRMADRMHRLGNVARRENYVARARKRLEAGHPGKNDAAVVLAAGG